MHVLNGCDTTSRLFGIGKSMALKKIKDKTFSEASTVFAGTEASEEEIAAAGERALVCLHNGKPGDSLNTLGHRKFCEKVSTGFVQVHTLPPTSSAAIYQSFRVYLQVQKWTQDLDSKAWVAVCYSLITDE